MKAWVVETGSWENNSIAGIFSSEKLAKEYLATMLSIGEDGLIGPTKYELNKPCAIEYVYVGIYDIDGRVFLSGQAAEYQPDIDATYRGITRVKVKYSKFLGSMVKEAREKLEKYRADNKGL